jgi:hypothetical protein
MLGTGFSYFSSFIFLQTSVTCPVLESIRVVAGAQLQVTVLAFSCPVTTQCSIVSADDGGNWLRIGAGVATAGCFFAAQPPRSVDKNNPATARDLFILLPSLSFPFVD